MYPVSNFTGQAIAVKTAQIFKYYADVQKLSVKCCFHIYVVSNATFLSGIQRYVPRSPRSLTSALGTELARYDQICDSLESQLVSMILRTNKT